MWLQGIHFQHQRMTDPRIDTQMKRFNQVGEERRNVRMHYLSNPNRQATTDAFKSLNTPSRRGPSGEGRVIME